MKYRAIFEHSAEGHWLADVPELPGCSVSGRTIAEARERLKEALSVYDGEAQIEEAVSW